MHANLSLQQAPPFSVPARFLVSAPLFGMVAALVMLWHGPEMISHRWTPELLAVTHFLTLGFLAMSMLGALMQLMPVLMGMVIPRAILFSSMVHTPLFLGSACLGLAWLININELFIIAMALLGFSFTIFIVVVTERLLRSKNRHVTRSMMMLALFALFITAILGIYLAMGYASADFSLARQLTDLHLSWGLLGWVALLIMAVAYQVIPMFQITDEYPARHQRWMGWSLFIALLALSLAYNWPSEILKSISQIFLAACLLIFALTTLWVLQTRRRQIPDLTMMFWQLAMVSLILLILAWAIATLMNFDLPVLLGVLIIHGFAMTTITGMMYKIIPFLIWLHLSTRNKNLRDKGERTSQVKVPHMRKIIPEAAGLWQFRLHSISLVLLILAAIWPDWFFYPATLVFFIAQTALFFNLSKAVYFYNAKIAELETQQS
ncbi:MAG: hypothetical protein KAJ92_06390 [Gammaproteobacteria bacterium]|nr:hypothetical protein [Gammaproteobacteria bacterium]MCK5263296.1 hypothetical protein [Gammaproteobacteria bacterium]